MVRVVVVSAEPGAGKTGVAAAVARHFAYAGRAAVLARLEGEGRAQADAAFFASLPFAPGSPAAPVGQAAASSLEAAVVVLEAALEAAPALKADAAVLVVRGGAAGAKAPAGLTVRAIVATATHAREAGSVRDGDILRVALAEDRVLAGFSVSELRDALNAEVLVPGDGPDPTCDHLLIAPIGSDAGQPYLRRFSRPAIVCRFDKTDMHLAALRAKPSCLVLTGGRRPSDYLFDAAGSTGTPVLLSRTDTENTVLALEGIFEGTRFQGEEKLERMAELLEPTGLFEALAS